LVVVSANCKLAIWLLYRHIGNQQFNWTELHHYSEQVFFIFNSDFHVNWIAQHCLKDINTTPHLCLGLPHGPTPSCLRLNLRIHSTFSTVLTTESTHHTTLHFIFRTLICGKYKFLSSTVNITQFPYRRALSL
jgi:hypothetical protein